MRAIAFVGLVAYAGCTIEVKSPDSREQEMASSSVDAARVMMTAVMAAPIAPVIQVPSQAASNPRAPALPPSAGKPPLPALSSKADPRLASELWHRRTSDDCVMLVSFQSTAGRPVFMRVTSCELKDGSIGQEMFAGEFVADAQTIVVNPDTSSCEVHSTAQLAFAYRVADDGTALRVSTDSETLDLINVKNNDGNSRGLMSPGGEEYGCFDSSGFSPHPLLSF